MKEKILIMLSILAIARERKKCEIKPSSVREKKPELKFFLFSVDYRINSNHNPRMKNTEEEKKHKR